MKVRPGKRLSAFVLVAMLLAGSVIFYKAWDRDEMLRVTLFWGRLAPLPTSAHDFVISKGGTMFTRSFRASFSAPSGDIEIWLRNSPGTYNSVPEPLSPGVRKFLISPGGGAQHAEVTVDDNRGVVMIYVYWS